MSDQSDVILVFGATGRVEAFRGIPVDSDPESVLLHTHMGSSVLMSTHSDRKAAGHLAKTTGARSLVLTFRRSPEHKYPAQVDEGQHSLIMGAGRADAVDRTIGEMGRWLRSTLGLQTAVA